jgi:hypothetical protein
MWGIHAIQFERNMREVEKEEDLRKRLKMLIQQKADFQRNNRGTIADEVISQYNIEIDKLKEEISIESLLGSNNIEKTINKHLVPNKLVDKPFEEFLLIPMPVGLIEILHQNLKDAKGKRTATVMLALEKKGYLSTSFRNKRALFEAMKSKFGVSGAYSGVSFYLNRNNKGSITNDEIEALTNILP